MSKYKCPCEKEVKETSGVTIRIIDGQARVDIKCSCGKYMDLDAPKRNYTKEGCASFGNMDKLGRSR